MHNMTVAVISNTGADANFQTDQWVFTGEATETFSVPIPPLALFICAGIFGFIVVRVRYRHH